MKCAILDSYGRGLIFSNSKQAQALRNSRFAAPTKTIVLILVGWLSAGTVKSSAQSLTFAGNPQHTAQYPVRPQHLNRVFWGTSVDETHNTGGSHYGAPLITASNTVIVPTVTSGIQGATASVHYSIKVYEGGTGRLKYALTNDYTPPSLSISSDTWWPVYQPVLVALPPALRLYYPGAGGTVYYVENPDSDTPGPPVQICFYTNLTGYASNAAAFNSRVRIATPLTASTNGTIYFGYRATGTIPPPMNTNVSGFVRIAANGNAAYVAVGSSPLNCAPAIGNDGSTIYVAAFTAGRYLLGLDSETLATKFLHDFLEPPYIQFDDNATASPTVGPDGDVYFGVRAQLLHFSGDLTTSKLQGFFGWDYTVAVVPAALVPSYNGPSSYLLFSKYNDYGTRNRIALLDPNTPQSKSGRTCMREVLTAFSPTPAGSSQTEWCINTAAVSPSFPIAFAPNEDGRLYCWDLAANSFSEAFALNAGFREPYVPTAVGPDGTIYTINGGMLFAIGQNTNLDVTISSSAPDLTSVLPMQPLTFTATVTNVNPSDPVPAGTVTFQDITYEPAIRVTNVLATDVVLSNYTAAVTVSALSSNSGNHFITAIYSGDTNYPSASISMLQKVHAMASRTLVTSSIPYPGSNQVTFAAAVTNVGSSGPMRTGMVSFWDGTNFLWQSELNSDGQASFTITNYPAGSHAIIARYFSDATYAASSGAVAGVPTTLSQMQVMQDGTFTIGFTNISGAPFTVLSSTNLLAPLNEWTTLGLASELLPGQFQYSDAQAGIRDAARFYALRSP